MGGDKITVYTEIPSLIKPFNEQYFEDAERDLTPITPDGWRKSKRHGFYIDVEPARPKRDMRVLIDGTYIRDQLLATESWEEVDKHSRPITDLPKVFDLETRRYK